MVIVRFVQQCQYIHQCRQRLPWKFLYRTNSYNKTETHAKIANKNNEAYLGKATESLQKKTSPNVDLKASNQISVKHFRKESANSYLIKHCLERNPGKDGFLKAIDIYINKNKTRRGHIDFITTALKFIEPYKLEKDIEVYNKLFDVFPREKFKNNSLFDVVWPKAHPQMFLALDILTKMEWQGVIPTDETHDILYEIFGPSSLPLQKIYRFWFWFWEFRDLNPYKLSDEVYNDRLDVIRAAIDRILGNNNGTDIIENSLPIEKDGKVNYDHFIVNSQTSEQRQYLNACSLEQPLYVEGPVHIWMNHQMEEYFVIKTGKGDLVSIEDTKVDPDEEREGVILGICFATKPFEETLQKWITHLQKNNPSLKDFKIIFDINDKDSYHDDLLTISSS